MLEYQYNGEKTRSPKRKGALSILLKLLINSSLVITNQALYYNNTGAYQERPTWHHHRQNYGDYIYHIVLLSSHEAL